MARGIVAACVGFGAVLCLGLSAHAAEPANRDADRNRIARLVDALVPPVMAEHGVPGMAVAVTVRGERYLFNYGVAGEGAGKGAAKGAATADARADGPKVSEETIFEIGSLSKTFTATLAAYAQAKGALSLSDKASRYWPALSGTAFDGVSLLELGTYTAGGLPLQFPAGVDDEASLAAFYRGWRPGYAPGTHRLYSNTSLGLFGYLAARSMGAPFESLMQGTLFPALGLTRTYIQVPDDRMGDYAYGHAGDGQPVRVSPGALDAEAYGVKTTASDMIHFVETNMDASGLDESLRRAIDATHRGYFRLGAMMQGLGWETYAYPVTLDALLAGNAPDVILKPNPVTRLDPPAAPSDMLINKTGSTNGFGAYTAFVPARKIGIVLLANRNYPIPARVKLAHAILTAIDGERASNPVR